MVFPPHDRDGADVGVVRSAASVTASHATEVAQRPVRQHGRLHRQVAVHRREHHVRGIEEDRSATRIVENNDQWPASVP